jgi:hypothetical protein
MFKAKDQIKSRVLANLCIAYSGQLNYVLIMKGSVKKRKRTTLIVVDKLEVVNKISG